MEYGLSICGILKIADNEIEFFTNETEVLNHGTERLTESDLTEMLVCKYSSISDDDKKGAIRAMPDRNEVLRIKKISELFQ